MVATRLFAMLSDRGEVEVRHLGEDLIVLTLLTTTDSSRDADLRRLLSDPPFPGWRLAVLPEDGTEPGEP